MPNEKSDSLSLPALRGTFGSWIFYSCLMPIREVGQRTDYATDLHPAKADELSQLIQRALEGHRSQEIASYLTSNEDRFFNSLVLAVYGGQPDWLEIGIEGSQTSRASLDELTQEAKDSIGFLRLSGTERLFAIDGQHRLAGIKKAIATNLPLSDELVPIIFVGHANNAVGLRRTRRLFTTLNKTAVPVTKRDIIALDEDDVMAIVARSLYETDPRFSKPRTAIITTNNLPISSKALTTIGNLYDVLRLIFMHETGVKRDTTLRFNRPNDETLERFRGIARSYFAALAKNFPPLNSYFRSKEPARIAKRYRSSEGGHILFRPIGLDLISRASIALAQHRQISLPAAVSLVSKVETNLSKKPYVDVIWDPDHGTIISQGKSLARRLVCYTLGLPCRSDVLLREYRRYLGADEADRSITLPKRVLKE